VWASISLPGTKQDRLSTCPKVWASISLPSTKHDLLSTCPKIGHQSPSPLKSKIACPLVQSLGIKLPPHQNARSTVHLSKVWVSISLPCTKHDRLSTCPKFGDQSPSPILRAPDCSLHIAAALPSTACTSIPRPWKWCQECGTRVPRSNSPGTAWCRSSHHGRTELSVLLHHVALALLRERIASKLVHKSARLDRTGVAQYLALVVCQTPELERGNACLEGGNHTGVGPRAREGL